MKSVSRIAITALIVLACGADAAAPVFTPAPGSPFPAGPSPVATQVVDIDRDGHVDIITADSGADTVTVLRGDGRGGFARTRSFPAIAQPHLLVAGDFNSDKHPDLAVTAHDSNSVALLINDGSGALLPPRTIAVFHGGGPHNHGLVAADVNGDGNLDLTVGHQGLNQIAVLLGDGRGGFRGTASPAHTGRAPYPHAMVDVNGDRKPDLVVPNVQGGDVHVFAGDGAGGFVMLRRVSTGIERPYFVAAADLNRDRKVDLVVSHDDTSRVAVMLGDGKGSFRHATGSPFDTGPRGSAISVGDLDRDGLPDLAVAAGDNILLFKGDGSGRFDRLPVLPAGGWHVSLADVNGDGRVDVIAPATERNQVHVFLIH